MNALNVPVLLIVFNRPETTYKVLNRLLECENISKIYVSCDGPRESGQDDINVNLVKKIIRDAEFKVEIIKNYSDKNQGCKMGVKNAIDWFFENEESGVIIEDDCLPSHTFFAYCGELLEKYKNNKSIYSIDGSNYSKITSSVDSYSFSKYTMIWGWATWRDRWDKMDLEMKDIENFYIEKFKNKFPLFNERLYWKMHLDNVKDGKIDTWDFQWMYTIWNNNGKIIAPKLNMIKNIGFGDNATHSKTSSSLFDLAICEDIIFPLNHPDEIIFDKNLDLLLSKYRFRINFKSNIRRYIKNYLKL